MSTPRLVLLALALALTAPQLPPDAKVLLDQLADITRKLQQLLTPQPTWTVVRTAAELQAALAMEGARIEIPPDTRLTAIGGFIVRARDIHIKGHGPTSVLYGDRGPALHVPAATPAITDIRVEALSGAASDGYAAVFRCGNNDAEQTTLERVPRRVLYADIDVPRHLGQRAFEMACADFNIHNSRVGEVYSPGGADSQAVLVVNTPGPGLIDSNQLAAGSEVIMIGGDTVKIPGLRIRGIIISNNCLCRPPEWRTDTVRRVVKTGLELKDGEDVLVMNNTIRGNWRDAQAGNAITITPRAGGAIRNITFESNHIRDSATGYNITGHDIAGTAERPIPPTPFRTTGIVDRNSTFDVSTAFGGHGILALLGMGPDTVSFENVAVRGNGNALIRSGDRERIGRIRVVNSLATVGSYSVVGPPGNNLANWRDWLDAYEITGNTFTGASSLVTASNPSGVSGFFRTAAPENTFLPRAEWEVLAEPRFRQ